MKSRKKNENYIITIDNVQYNDGRENRFTFSTVGDYRTCGDSQIIAYQDSANKDEVIAEATAYIKGKLGTAATEAPSEIPAPMTTEGTAGVLRSVTFFFSTSRIR